MLNILKFLNNFINIYNLKINMKEILKLLALFLLLIFSGCSNYESSKINSNENQTFIETKQTLAPTEENFLKILSNDKDGKEYLEKYPSTKIVKFTKIKPSQFESLKNNTNYKELYIDLPNKELYQVDFNGGSTLSLTTVIDLEEEKVVKIFGIYIMGMG